MWRGGRRYHVYDGMSRPHIGPEGWEYITSDGGRVADVAAYVARAIVNDRETIGARA